MGQTWQPIPQQFPEPGPGPRTLTRGASLFRISWKACKLLVPELDLEAMPWPLPSDFQTILQNPKIAFRDPYLRSCQIERDLRGQPRAWAGSFAVVYKGIDATGKPLAIRVFSTESPKRRGRYEQIGEHLTARKLDCLVSFEYREDEIRSLSDGKRYPIVLMDWVEGETLFQWGPENQCQRGNLAAFA